MPSIPPTLAASLDGLDDRLREGLAQLDAAIAESERAMQQLKTERQSFLRILRAIDPDMAAPGRQRQGGARNRSGLAAPTPGKVVSAERLESAEAWLREHIGEDETFHASGLAARSDWDIASQSQTSAVLRILADRSVIRLDNIKKKGGAKSYKLNPNRSSRDGD
jgi:hypothetical protein